MGISKRRFWTVPGMLFTVGLLVAACGGASTAGAAVSPRATAGGAPLVVGEIDSQSGGSQAGVVTDLPDSVKLWAAYVNGHGGINGHRVKVIDKNDNNDPATSTADVHALISQDHVIALLDGSGQDAAWASFASQSKVPVISLSEAGDGFQYFTQPDFFANGTTVLTILWGQLKAAAEAGAKTYGLIYCSEVPACAQAAPVTKSLAKTIPINVVYVAKASNSQPDYTAVCLGAKQAGAKAVFAAGVAPQRVADDCARQGYKPIWITSQGTVNPAAIKDPNLSSSTGDLQDFPWMLSATPAQKLFHRIEDHELARANTQANVDFAYVGAVLFQTAATAGVKAGNKAPSAQDILNGLYTIHGSTLGGLAPPLSFKVGKANPVSCVFLYGVVKGKYAATHGDKYFCQS
jgi:branched-chain amino acid transport system substrate-binding protein